MTGQPAKALSLVLRQSLMGVASDRLRKNDLMLSS